MGRPTPVRRRARAPALLRRTQSWQVQAQLPWRAARFAVVDLETTGLDIARDEVVSAGAAFVQDGRLRSHTFYEVARPRRSICEAAMRVHALTATELESAPPFAEVLVRFRAEIAGSVLVAHAAWVERGFLNRALRPYGERLPDRLVDTAALARALGLVQSQSGREPSLEGLARRLDLPVHTPHHALGDAVTTAQVFLVLATRLEQRCELITVGDLMELSMAHGR